MSVDIQLDSIQRVKNSIEEGQVKDPDILMEFKPKISKDNIELIDIRWTFSFNISPNKYVFHQSKTIFTCSELLFDKYLLEDSRIDLLSQLGQISMSHSRTLFFEDNKSVTELLPLILWNHQITENLKFQISSLLN